MTTINSTYKNTTSDEIVVIVNIEKRGRWTYIQFSNVVWGDLSNKTEMTEQGFTKTYEPCPDPRTTPRTVLQQVMDEFTPAKVEGGVTIENVVTDEQIDDAITADQIDEVKSELAPALKGFAKFRANHKPVKVGDKRVQHNGDPLAQVLQSCSLAEVYSYAAKVLGEPIPQLEARYQHLNPGMQRMNLGNRIRGAQRKLTSEVTE